MTNEPDQALWQDPSTGLKCLILRHPQGQHLCGYIVLDEAPNVPEGFYENARVHGGVTFNYQASGPNWPEGIPGKYLIGFDCAHACLLYTSPSPRDS